MIVRGHIHLKESGVFSISALRITGLILIVSWMISLGIAMAQTLETSAGTVIVKPIPGKSTQEVLQAALEQLQPRQDSSTKDDPRAVFALRQTGANIITDVYGNVATLNFIKPGSTSNDLKAASKFTDKDSVHLTGLVSIRTLNLSGASITNVSLETIGKMDTLSNLHLASTAINDDGLAYLASLVDLRYLDLGSCQITGKGLKPLKELDALLSINLTSTPLPDEHLADLVELESLRRVYLTGTLVTDEGIPTLKQMEQLKVLSLYATRVSDAALPALAEFPALETVYLEKSLVTTAGVKWLKEKLPKLLIYGP